MTSNRRKPGRPAATDSVDTRRALIEAARQCFGLYGFDKTSNGNIVKRAGVTTGPLYHHFGSKAELYGAVANDSIDQTFSRLENVLESTVDDGIFTRLAAVLSAVAETHAQDEALTRFDIIGPLELRRTPELVQHIDRDQMARMRRLFDEMISGAVAGGEIRSDVPHQSISDLITVLYFGLIYYFAVIGSEAEPAEVVETIMAGLDGSLFNAPT